jgi:hypothetical protein
VDPFQQTTGSIYHTCGLAGILYIAIASAVYNGAMKRAAERVRGFKTGWPGRFTGTDAGPARRRPDHNQ